MANINKIVEIVFGANPTESDLREIVRRIEAKLPQDEALRLTPSAMEAFEERIYQRVVQALAHAQNDEPTTDAAKTPRVAKK